MSAQLLTHMLLILKLPSLFLHWIRRYLSLSPLLGVLLLFWRLPSAHHRSQDYELRKIWCKNISELQFLFMKAPFYYCLLVVVPANGVLASYNVNKWRQLHFLKIFAWPFISRRTSEDTWDPKHQRIHEFQLKFFWLGYNLKVGSCKQPFQFGV